MVTRTFNMIERRCRVYEKETDSVKEETFTAKKTDKKWQSHITEQGYTFLTVIEEHEINYKLGMSDDDFFRLAEVMK